jgi:hypothetical protein
MVRTSCGIRRRLVDGARLGAGTKGAALMIVNFFSVSVHAPSHLDHCRLASSQIVLAS